MNIELHYDGRRLIEMHPDIAWALAEARRRDQQDQAEHRRLRRLAKRRAASLRDP